MVPAVALWGSWLVAPRVIPREESCQAGFSWVCEVVHVRVVCVGAG